MPDLVIPGHQTPLECWLCAAAGSENTVVKGVREPRQDPIIRLSRRYHLMSWRTGDMSDLVLGTLRTFTVAIRTREENQDVKPKEIICSFIHSFSSICSAFKCIYNMHLGRNGSLRLNTQKISIMVNANGEMECCDNWETQWGVELLGNFIRDREFLQKHS